MNPKIEKTGPDFDEIQQVIKEFLSKYRYLYEIRIQKLVYYGELYCLENYDRRLTDAEFKPYMYGSFSETVRQALHDLDIPTEEARRNGNKTVKYLSYGVDGGELEPAKKKIISRVHQLTKNESTESLAKMSKESWLYQNEEFDEPMDFERFLKEGKSGEFFDPESPELDEEEKDQLEDVGNRATAH